MGINIIAVIWGFAEASLFFIVPDVWLSILGRKKLKTGLIACFYSLTGALLGGAILYRWGAQDLQSAKTIISHIPAINNDMLQQVQTRLINEGATAMLLGPLSGTPYKTYAILANQTQISFWLFLAMTIPARLIRFLLVTTLVHFAVKAITKRVPINDLSLIITGWLIFYLGYFYVMMK